MMRSSLILATLLPLAPLPAAATAVGCGGNARSTVEVVRARPDQRRRGPIVVLPQTLCADLIEDRAPGIRGIDVNILLGDRPAPPDEPPGLPPR
jgi:hypothetical protein